MLELVERSLDPTRALDRRRAAAASREVPGRWLLETPRLTRTLDVAKRLAARPNTPIIIQGERGVGVRELARFVHDEDREGSAGRFRVVPAHAVDAAAMRGWLQRGTLFIEDVENLRTGGQEWVAGVLAQRWSSHSALRIIAGSQLSVSDLLQQRPIGAEIVHALDVSRLAIPALRDRPEEILLLARRFLLHFGGQERPALRFSPSAEAKLVAHSYPANVRELRNVVERAVALESPDHDEISDAAVVFYEEANPQPRETHVEARRTIDRFPSLAEVERDYLTMLIRECRGRRNLIARAMGVSAPTLLRKIRNHRLDVRAIVASGPDAGTAT